MVIANNFSVVNIFRTFVENGKLLVISYSWVYCDIFAMSVICYRFVLFWYTNNQKN